MIFRMNVNNLENDRGTLLYRTLDDCIDRCRKLVGLSDEAIDQVSAVVAFFAAVTT